MAKANKGAPAALSDFLEKQVAQLHPDLSLLLVAWQAQSGRHHLPWQQTRDPYRVWLSEIMLQQTQVTTVLGYYQRFLQRFPQVADLAAAPLDDVLTLWAGLGYYSRARNLHRCAQAVVVQHGGQFPQDVAQLVQLPGIGPSTAAAIAAFCFDAQTSIMDGNVKRVLSRVLGWDQDLAIKANERHLWAAANALVPQSAQDMAAYTQGLMDLGATVCTPRKPACLMCPWSELCTARRQGDPESLPVQTRKLKRSTRESWLFWLAWRDQVWLQQMPGSGVWAGLWTLPLLDSEVQMQSLLEDEDVRQVARQPRVKHVLTHLDWYLNPCRLVLPDGREPGEVLARLKAIQPVQPDGRWVAQSRLTEVGLPAPIARLLAVR